MNYYELIKDDVKIHDEFYCYRIRATQDFKNPYRDVKKGELGGYVTYPNTLESYSWVFGNAILINSILHNNSYIVGDFIYRGVDLRNSHIIGSGNYYNEWDATTLIDLSVVGQNAIQVQPRTIIWGTNTKTNETIVCVGCQNHSIENWRRNYQSISARHGFASYHNARYLGYLKQIEDSLNEKVLEKISENVESMKVSVTEPLKSETISLVTSLKVPETVVKTGPQRDKFGRFLKKTP